MMLVGGVELGGTKIRVARGSDDGRIEASETFQTTGPEPSFARILNFFRGGPPISALGVGAFGPVAVRPSDSDYGRLRGTPKPGWRDFDIAAAAGALGVPVALDTDVSAAGRGEAALGALAGLDCGIYLTVGTGIGGALVAHGQPLPGASHAEMGHVSLVRTPGDDFGSVCPWHANCAEGLASGPAIERRFGANLGALPDDHPGHALIAGYLGQLLASLVLVAAPNRIVIGGGVSKAPGLHARAHAALLAGLNGYGFYPEAGRPGFVVPPALGDDAGLAGALLMAGAEARRR
nr:ROK family protein [Sphingomonas horti]